MTHRSTLALPLALALAACSGGGGTRLSMPSGKHGNAPRISPDGTLIAFIMSSDSSDGDLAVMGIDGKNPHVLANLNNYLAAPVWSADGNQIYVASEDGIEVVPAAGGSPTKLADAFAAMEPDLSPDGTTLAWAINGGGIYTLDLTVTGAQPKHLVDGEAPRFSHDGQRLLFVQDAENAATISIFDLTTQQTTALIDTNNYLTNAVWFSDDQRIAYLSKDGIEVMTLADKSHRRVADEFAAMSLDLARDDRTMAYAVNGDGDIFLRTLGK